jgi:hypothetical protein
MKYNLTACLLTKRDGKRENLGNSVRWASSAMTINNAVVAHYAARPQ